MINETLIDIFFLSFSDGKEIEIKSRADVWFVNRIESTGVKWDFLMISVWRFWIWFEFEIFEENLQFLQIFKFHQDNTHAYYDYRIFKFKKAVKFQNIKFWSYFWFIKWFNLNYNKINWKTIEAWLKLSKSSYLKFNQYNLNFNEFNLNFKLII